jgi:uncharacterized protein (DUF4415 family)
MSARRRRSVNSSPRDEAPEITKEWIAGAELRRGKRLVRRGRPPTANPKQLLSLRLPPEVIAGWKATGPGWQTRMADVLKKSTPKTRRHVG